MNNRTLRWFLILVLAAAAAFFTWPYFTQVQLPEQTTTSFGSETVRAEVQEITDQGTITLGARSQTYQIARVRPLEGSTRVCSWRSIMGSDRCVRTITCLPPVIGS